MIKKIAILFVAVCTYMFADEASLLAVVKKMPLLQNQANFIEENGTIYLVGVGKIAIDGSSVQDKVNAIKISQVKAQKVILTMVHGSDIQVEEKLSKTITKTKLVIDGKVVNEDTQRIKHYARTIREMGSGILVMVKPLGKWKENGFYFFAYYLTIPSS